jgi:hypothetical protein
VEGTWQLAEIDGFVVIRAQMAAILDSVDPALMIQI